MSVRLVRELRELGMGGAEALPYAFPPLNTIAIFSITGSILMSLKSKSSLAM